MKEKLKLNLKNNYFEVNRFQPAFVTRYLSREQGAGVGCRSQ